MVLRSHQSNVRRYVDRKCERLSEIDASEHMKEIKSNAVLGQEGFSKTTTKKKSFEKLENNIGIRKFQ